VSKIILVRHGQTDWNKVERFRGRFDVPLNETGLKQAEATAERIAAGYDPGEIITSPLGRARQTAEAIARKTGLSPRDCRGLIDIDYGQWQGLTPDEVRARWPLDLRAWHENPETARIPGGELLAGVQERALNAVRDACARGSWGSSETIVMVSHTVVNRLILLGVLGAPRMPGATLSGFWRLKQDPCAINVVEFDGSSFSVAVMNDTCHLSATT
jgi:broad specificity phosphatase PhoE